MLRLPCGWYSKLVPWDADRSWKGIGLIQTLSTEKTSKTCQNTGNFQTTRTHSIPSRRDMNNWKAILKWIFIELLFFYILVDLYLLFTTVHVPLWRVQLWGPFDSRTISLARTQNPKPIILKPAIWVLVTKCGTIIHISLYLNHLMGVQIWGQFYSGTISLAETHNPWSYNPWYIFQDSSVCGTIIKMSPFT